MIVLKKKNRPFEKILSLSTANRLLINIDDCFLLSFEILQSVRKNRFCWSNERS